MFTNYLTGAAIFAVLVWLMCWTPGLSLRSNLRYTNWVVLSLLAAIWPVCVLSLVSELTAHVTDRIINFVVPR